MFHIDDIRRELLIKYPPFGSYLASLPFIEDRQCLYKGVPTASTDDTAIYYHPDFIEKLNSKQRIAVFAHEISHVVLEHIKRGEGKDFDTWNIATDASINENLKKDGLELVEGMIERSDALLYSEEELYEKILEEQKQNPNQKKKEPHVSHESWKKTRKQKDQDLKENKKLEESKCSMMSADELFQKARKEKLENLKKLKKSLIEQSLSINPNQNARNRSVGSLDGETNLVNWRKLLVDACHIDSDWTYQNATIEYGVLTPQREELPMPLVEILLDTSESIQDKLFRNFLRECMGILH